jgi:hypothetical protein
MSDGTAPGSPVRKPARKTKLAFRQSFPRHFWTNAEVKIGAELAKMPKAKGGAEKGVGRRGKQSGSVSAPHSVATLAELGVVGHSLIVADLQAGKGAAWGAYSQYETRAI